MKRSYVNEQGKSYYGAAADAHHTKLLGYNSAEDYADDSFNGGYDRGYLKGRDDEREQWKANHEAATRRKNIKVS